MTRDPIMPYLWVEGEKVGVAPGVAVKVAGAVAVVMVMVAREAVAVGSEEHTRLAQRLCRRYTQCRGRILLGQGHKSQAQSRQGPFE